MTAARYLVRPTTPDDIPSLIAICRAVYPASPPWSAEQLRSHQTVFPEGQLVVEDRGQRAILGFAASLIVRWDDYDWGAPWRDFTAAGYFTNHEPEGGRTLYGAEVMVNPAFQGRGTGSRLYAARERLAKRLRLLRIRAGARLRGYHRHASRMSAEEYTHAVIAGRLRDPTLSFQLRRGFHVLRVIADYLMHDPESLGFAAIIEWVNPDIATEADLEHRRRSEFHPTT